MTAVALPQTADQATSPRCLLHTGNDELGPVSAPSPFHVMAHVKNDCHAAYLGMNEDARAAPRAKAGAQHKRGNS